VNNEAEGRLVGGLGANLINTGIFNNRFTPANTWRPFANLGNRIPVSVNPNFDNPLATFDACTSPSGDAGICAPGNICSLFGGRPSGSCILGKVCCISKSNQILSYLLWRIEDHIELYVPTRFNHHLWRDGNLKQHVLAITDHGR
jgi:hypothetical protein